MVTRVLSISIIWTHVQGVLDVFNTFFIRSKYVLMVFATVNTCCLSSNTFENVFLRSSVNFNTCYMSSICYETIIPSVFSLEFVSLCMNSHYNTYFSEDSKCFATTSNYLYQVFLIILYDLSHSNQYSRRWASAFLNLYRISSLDFKVIPVYPAHVHVFWQF